MASLSLKDFNLIMETENPANKLTFQWTVRNMNKIPGVIRSGKFPLVSGQPSEWEVSIERDSSDTFEFNLTYLAPRDAVPIAVESCSSIIKNRISVLEREVESRYLFTGGYIGHLLNAVVFPASGDDTLVFQCAMTVFGYGSACSRTLYNDDSGRDVEELRNDYLSMMESTLLSDVMIFIGNREYFTAHKSVLKYLAPKFFSAHEGDILAGNVRLYFSWKVVFEDILRSIYSGRVSQTAIAEYFRFFYQPAVQYELKMLQRACTRELIYSMKKDNVHKLYDLTRVNDDQAGKSYCEAFMKDNQMRVRM